jgi:FkbM family methyltransferase
MTFWRFKWALQRLFSTSFHAKLKKNTRHPAQYYYALGATIFKKKPLDRALPIELRSKHVLWVNRMMSLFIIEEVFLDHFYDTNLPNNLNPTIVDVGGNHGYFSIRMKELFPESTIYSFEPDESNFAMLVRNISSVRSTKPIRARQKGVCAHTRVETLYIHPTNIGGHSIIAETENQETESISIVGLEEFMLQHDIQKIDFLKLDCEGAEKEILESLNVNLAKKIHKIVYEPTPRLYNPVEMNKFLEKLGYKISEGQGVFYATL